jgi:hypothetical protein
MPFHDPSSLEAVPEIRQRGDSNVPLSVADRSHNRCYQRAGAVGGSRDDQT